MRLLAVALVGLLACRARTPPRELVHQLRAHDVARWKLTPAQWAATVTEPYTGAYADYARAFDAAVPQLTAQLAHATTFTPRAHFAGNPLLTRGQARARWALPVQYPAQVVMVDAAPLDAVFVRVPGGWGAIVGVDQLLLDRVAAQQPACAAYLATVGAKQCEEVAWVIAEAALRSDQPRLVHACTLAATACTRASPRPAVVQPSP